LLRVAIRTGSSWTWAAADGGVTEGDVAFAVFAGCVPASEDAVGDGSALARGATSSTVNTARRKILWFVIAISRLAARTGRELHLQQP
jgi:hypothetical protein